MIGDGHHSITREYLNYPKLDALSLKKSIIRPEAERSDTEALNIEIPISKISPENGKTFSTYSSFNSGIQIYICLFFF